MTHSAVCCVFSRLTTTINHLKQKVMEQEQELKKLREQTREKKGTKVLNEAASWI